MKLIHTLGLLLLTYLSVQAQLDLKQVIYEKQYDIADVLLIADLNADEKEDAILENRIQLDFFGDQPVDKAWDSSYILDNATTGDLDEDGDLDFVTTLPSGGLFGFFNDGEGNFNFELLSSQQEAVIAVEDVNEDGHLDILSIAANGTGNPAQLVLHERDTNTGSWTTTVLVEDVDFTVLNEFAVYADVDGDGDKDITIGLGFFLYRFEQTSLANFDLELLTLPTETFYITVDQLHLNQDGIEDYIFGVTDCDHILAYGNEDGTLTLSTIDSNIACDLLLVFDLNRDGHKDLLMKDPTSRGRWLMNDAQGGFTQGELWPKSMSNIWVRYLARDINADGVDDLIISDPRAERIILLQSNETGYERSTLRQNDVVSVDWVQQVDMDNDGDLDLLVHGDRSANFVLFRNNGQAGFERMILVDELFPVSHSKLSDLDGDGRPELLFLQSIALPADYPLTAAFFNQDMQVINQQVLLSDAGIQFLEAADMDGDGKEEILVYDISTVSIWNVQTATSLQIQETLSITSLAMRQLFVCDWNNDGWQDILASSDMPTNFSIELFAGSQDGLTEEAVQIFYQEDQGLTNPWLNLSDWNQDGRPDLIYREGTEGHLMMADTDNSVTIAHSLTFLQTPNLYKLPASAADLDNDGQADIISNQEAFLRQGNDYQFFNYQTGQEQILPHVVADFDQDGLNELILISKDDEITQWQYDLYNTSIETDPKIDPSNWIYPNPSSGMLLINLPRQASKIEIYNATGQLVYQESNPTNAKSIDLTHLKSGVYLLTVIIGETSKSNRLVLLD